MKKTKRPNFPLRLSKTEPRTSVTGAKERGPLEEIGFEPRRAKRAAQFLVPRMTIIGANCPSAALNELWRLMRTTRASAQN